MTKSVAVPPPPVPVVNDHTGPGVLPPLDTAVIRQKYTVDGASDAVEYDELVCPVAPVGGGLAVTNATLNVVPTAPGAQPSVGVRLTPVAPSDGDGLDGAAGGPGVPPVVNDQIADGAISDGMSGVAFVRETTFQ